MTEDRHGYGNLKAARLFVRCCGLLPLCLRRAFFVLLAKLYYLLFPRHRLIALHNLKNAFPDKDMKEIASIARGAYRNIALVGAEFFDIPGLTKDNVFDFVEVTGLENCENAFKKGKGLLVFSAHFGNWEFSAAAMALILGPAVVLYRPLDNSLLDNIVYYVRSSTGNSLIPKERAMIQSRRALSKNGIVGIIIDQNMAVSEGVFVNFFHRPACTTDGIAQLAMRTGAPVIPAFLIRTERGRQRLVLGEEIEVVSGGEWNADVVVNTQKFTSVIEDMVRAHPEQWLWIHHRWKTKPWQKE